MLEAAKVLTVLKGYRAVPTAGVGRARRVAYRSSEPDARNATHEARIRRP
jgi:hypothetical protein